MGPLKNRLFSDTTHQIWRVHPEPNNNGQERNSGKPRQQTMVHRGWSERWSNYCLVIPVMEWLRQVHYMQMDSELLIIGTVAGHWVSFLIYRHRWPFHFNLLWGPLQPSEVAMRGSQASFLSQNNPLLSLCSFDQTTLTYSYIVVPHCPMALIGCDLLAKLQTVINLPFSDPISNSCIKWHPKPLASPHSQTTPWPLVK